MNKRILQCSYPRVKRLRQSLGLTCAGENSLRTAAESQLKNRHGRRGSSVFRVGSSSLRRRARIFSFFVPGGRITKNETLAAAFERITFAELGVRMELNLARFIGLYEHIYHENVFEKEGFGTHYVVLACELILSETPASLPTQQHEDYVWKMEREVLDWPTVHEYTKAYFRDLPR